MTYIVTQFVAHDVSHLKLDENFKLIGEKKYRSRLSSLLRFCSKWYLIFGGIILAVLVIVGGIFFNRYSAEHKGVDWFLPWILLAIGSALNFLAAPILSFIEGLGKVKEVAQATSRVMVDEEGVPEKCAVCGKPAKHKVVFARAY